MVKPRAGRWLLHAVVLLAGCGGSQRSLRSAEPAALADAAWVRDWDAIVRPDALYTLAALMSATGEDPAGGCPSVIQTTTAVDVRGGCTSAEGEAWTGRARIRRSSGGATELRLREFGHDGSSVDGRASVDDMPMRAELDVYLKLAEGYGGDAGPTWLAIDYRAQQRADGGWVGEGDIAAEGRGRVHARTSAMIVDHDRCDSEPLQGWTELEAGGHRVRVTYDGALDCDPEATARWTLDGVARGELQGIDSGVGCRFDPEPRPLGVLGLLVLLGLRRRRR